MFKRFISLEWKQFTRSSYFQRSLIVKILLFFVALYFIVSFLIMGGAAYFLLEEVFPKKDPLEVVNNYLIFWFLLEMVYRFFVQKLPVMNVKPLMTLPIKRKTMIHYLLGKTTFSFFNILPLFFFVPFTFILLIQGYAPAHVLLWFVAIICFELSVNYLNFLINKTNSAFYVVLAVLVGLGGLQYFGIYDVTEAAGYFFNFIYEHLYGFLIPMALVILLYRRNYAFVRKDFYVDEKVSETTKEVTTSELNWLDRFGKLAVFLKNDIRMIRRNKRPRKVVLTSFIFLFYGLLFFPNPTFDNMIWFMAFVSIFITGGFLLSFGQLVPSWDSEYYKLLMSQNISYRKYLESKWMLMVVATGISFILSTPYLYFGWEIYEFVVAGALFNIGLNSFITLYGGVLNRVPIELNVKSKAFGNTQGFNMTQLLIALPKMLGPILIFVVPYKLIGYQAGVIALALSGVIGLAFKNQIFNLIENTYQKHKYKTIAAFDEKK